MRTLSRNTQPLYYATFVGKTEITDEYGKGTGQYQITYSAPVEAKWNVGFVESDAEVEMFGIKATSTLKIVASRRNFPLDDASILWYGKEPQTPYNATAPQNNYVVAGIRPSLNGVVFYAKKVATA